MIDYLVVTVPGVPAPKPRQTQRDKWKPSAAVQRYRAYADQLKWATRQAMRSRKPLDGPIALSATFSLPIPPTWARDERLAAQEFKIPHGVKPDLKNLVAGLEDALNGIAWWDDAQIVSYGHISKRYEDGKGPRTFFMATPVGQELGYPQGEAARLGHVKGQVT